MSNPSPLIPQGTFQAQANKGASNVRIAVATIVAIHVVFFGGLLLQGCKPTKTAGTAGETNSAGSTNLSFPPMDPSPYYSNASALPGESSNRMYTGAGTVSPDYNAPGNAATVRDTLAPSTLNQSSTGITPPPSDISSPGTGATKEYTVARGDTYARIAAAHGTTVNALKKANPTIDPSKLRPSMKIQVPSGGPATAATAGGAGVINNSAGPDLSGNTASGGNSYTVKQGDTLTRIAKAHNVTVAQLRAANNFKTSGLKVNQKIKIPAPSAAGSEPAPKHTNVTAKPAAKKASTNSTTL